ncbi:MAG: phosphomannose isomerase type II C-terminal cupin domain [Deltaproteobacteria bacterium]|nr:phosphomannose isomerase type II C-terminal cupin domain [Deltaproteobacteria bacterium]MBF0507424.1 phosphomannose isomerase type II C-terminal cupin domain [Deltaproteobacteria bacterium]
MVRLYDRPWGCWEEYIDERGYRVKRIIISSGKRFSLQYHHLRSEHWVIVQGRGRLTIDDSQRDVSVGDYVFIPVNCQHRLENIDEENLVFIVIQLGKCLEEDIVRLEDDWNR